MKFVADPLFWIWLSALLVGFRMVRHGAAKPLQTEAPGGLRERLRRCFRWDTRRAGFLLIGVALASSAFEALQIPARLLAGLERPYLHSADSVRSRNERVDAVIVLGGYMEEWPRSYTAMEWADSADRLMTGVALVRDGNGTVLVLGGGGKGNPPQPVEAQAAAKWIRDWKLLSAPILFLGVSRNTHDEAVRTAPVAAEHGWERIILVTSAWHMKRSEATFRKTLPSLEIVPVACDFQGTVALHRRPSFVPRSRSLVDLCMWAEESLGRLYYKMRSWG